MRTVEWGHFRRDLQPDEAATLFKRSITLVAFSISSYCNRQCSYCPNVIVDRKSARNFMSDDLFFGILRQLSRIDYSEEINVTRYNEPLADKDYALSRLRDIRVFLPKARIHIYSNGDYLDRAFLHALADVGVDAILVTVHAGAGGKTDFASVVTEQDRRLAEYGTSFSFDGDGLGDRYRIATGKISDRMTLSVAAHDFYRGAESGEAWAFDRGGSLPIPKTFRRSDPCVVQFSEMSIEWDGTLWPCCQIHSDVPAHQKYQLGKLLPDSDMFLAWADLNYVRWRVRMYNYDPKEAPCTTCAYGRPMGDQAVIRATSEKLRRVLQDQAARAAAG